MKILVLDNYDSFTYNLVYIIRSLGYRNQMDIYRNDKIDLNKVSEYDLILLSPGPGVPKDAGIMPELIRQYGATKNILGVCLGHQAIGEAYGAKLVNLSEVVHGLATDVEVKQEEQLFQGLPDKFKIGRYHSWVIDPKNLSHELEVTAKSLDGQIMAIKHIKHQVRGIQFHPESILTEFGYEMIQNWIKSY
jgi:anthranilate synthase component II